MNMEWKSGDEPVIHLNFFLTINGEDVCHFDISGPAYL